tara:strand:+ start:3250 stop:3396 length:147 start_codon:yes stop_codon:yes gene_type:complete
MLALKKFARMVLVTVLGIVLETVLETVLGVVLETICEQLYLKIGARAA